MAADPNSVAYQDGYAEGEWVANNMAAGADGVADVAQRCSEMGTYQVAAGVDMAGGGGRDMFIGCVQAVADHNGAAFGFTAEEVVAYVDSDQYDHDQASLAAAAEASSRPAATRPPSSSTTQGPTSQTKPTPSTTPTQRSAPTTTAAPTGPAALTGRTYDLPQVQVRIDAIRTYPTGATTGPAAVELVTTATAARAGAMFRYVATLRGADGSAATACFAAPTEAAAAGETQELIASVDMTALPGPGQWEAIIVAATSNCF